MRAGALIFVMVLSTLLGSPKLLGQETGLVVDMISALHGLRGSVVLSSFVDSRSKLWIGTDSGLSFMDGARVFPAEVGRDLILVAAITEHPVGTLWIGHARGLGRLRRGVYEEIKLPGEFRVVKIVPRRDHLIVASHQGLLRVNADGAAKKLQFDLEAPWKPSADLVLSLLDSPTHGFLVGSAAGTFVLQDDDQLEFLCRIGDLSLPFEERSTWAMVELDDGRLMLGSRAGSFLYEPDRKKVSKLPLAPSATGRRLTVVDYHKAKDGSIWAASPWSALSRWNPQDQRFETFRFAVSDGSAVREEVSTFSVSGSADGLIWVASVSGLYAFEDQPKLTQVHFPKDQNADGKRQIFDATQLADGSILLAAGADGLQYYNAEFEPISIEDHGLATTGVVALNELAGAYYFANGGGQVLRFDGTGLSLVLDRSQTQAVAQRIIATLPRRDGSILVAGPDGLWQFEAGAVVREVTGHNGRPFRGPFSVDVDGLSEDSRGDLWVRTNAALIREDVAGRVYRYGSTKSPDLSLAISGDRVRQVAEVRPGQHLIVSAGRLGLLDVDQKTYVDYEFKPMTNRDLGFIHRVLIAGDRVWALADSSLLLLDLDESSARECQVSFAKNDRMAGNLFRGRNGGILAADGEGLVVIEMETALSFKAPPCPKLRAVEVLGDSVPIEAWDEFQELPEDHNRITFEVRSGSRLRVDDTRFSLRLKGADNDWQDVGFQGRINYAGLDPGDYVFEARSEFGGGVWSEPVTLARFRILTPIWKTIPFQVAVGLLCGLLLILGFRRQVGLERRRSEVLEAVVADRTESLRTKSDELERLYSVVKNINSSNTLDELMHTTLAESMAMLGADAGRFYVRREESWELAVRVGWQQERDATLSAALTSRLHLASPTRPIEQMVDTPTDVMDESGRHRESCSLMMHLDDEGSLEACMILDYWERLSPATTLKLNLVERLYQPVMLAYRKLRLLETAERLNNLKNELLGAAAHDLRSPLTVIGMTAEMMKNEAARDWQPTDHVLREIEMIKSATTRMAAMVDKLLDISAIESGRVEVDMAEVDLRRVVRDRVDFFGKLADARRISMRLGGEPVELPVQADAERIGTALDNLLSNALKYTPSGGEVLVSCSRVGGEVVVDVTDDGQGLPPEDAKDLFNHFRRMSAEPAHGEHSSGLGLAIVKRIVDLHGGRVFARSELRLGSTFGFALPLRRETARL